LVAAPIADGFANTLQKRFETTACFKPEVAGPRTPLVYKGVI
jgi:hypothetical protein